MKVYIKHEFPTEVSRYGEDGATVSSEQYLPYLTSLSPLSLNIGDDHSFEISNVTAIYDDIDNHFRNKFSDAINKDIQGSLATFYNSSGTKLATLKVWDYQFLPDSKFQMTYTNKIGELWNDFTEKITEEEFPSTPTDSVNQVIPDVYGNATAGGGTGGTIKCWHVEAGKYLCNATVVAGSSLVASYLEDGTVITGTSAMAATADGLRTTIDYNTTAPDFIICDIIIGSYAGNNVQDVLEANLNKWVVFNSGNYTPNTDLDDLLDGALYNAQFKYYNNTTVKKGEELLKDFCNSYNVDWITNSDNEVEIKFIDINNLTADHTIQPNKAKEYSYTASVDPEEYVNQAFVQGHYNDYSQTYQKQFQYDEFESQSMFGVRPENIPAKFLKVDENVVWTAKYFTMFNKNPRQRAFTQMYISDWFDNTMEVGDKISFRHPDDRLKGATDILYQIRKVTIDFSGNLVNLELWDIDYLKNIDTNINLLVQSNAGNGYLDYFDLAMSMDGTANHILNPALSISNQNTEVLFQKSSIYAWGSRRITTGNASEWDIFNSTVNDATLSAYIFPHDLSATFTNAQPIFEHYQDANNRWVLRLEPVPPGSTGKLQLVLISGGIQIFNIISTTALTVGSWFHVAMCKSGSDIGIYINGTQEAYVSLGSAYNFAGTLYLFGTHPQSVYLQAYVSEAFLSNNNFYSGAPVVGVTDTITPYWQPLTQEADNKTLTVYNPRVGDVWTIGKTYRVKWNVPGLNTVIELWDSAGSGGAKIADLGTATNKQYIDIDSTGLAAADRTIKVYDADGNISDWSDVFTISA